MSIDPAWVITGIVSVVGGGVLISHIREDGARHRELDLQAKRFDTLRSEVRAFLDEARKSLPK